jgi:cell division protein FtsB
MLGFALLAYIFIFGGYGLIRILTLKKNIRDTERQTTISSAIKEALISDKHSLESDEVYLERVIRETFGMIKGGERCTVIIK